LEKIGLGKGSTLRIADQEVRRKKRRGTEEGTRVQGGKRPTGEKKPS